MTQHPELHVVNAVCATCGTTFTVRTTAESLSVELCSNCHPAYTGRERATVTGSRIERFERRLTNARA